MNKLLSGLVYDVDRLSMLAEMIAKIWPNELCIFAHYRCAFVHITGCASKIEYSGTSLKNRLKSVADRLQWVYFILQHFRLVGV